MYLNHLSVSGFRGISNELNLPLANRTIIYGPNGSGKSSLLQSIAWALYGNLPTFSGGAFAKEDALVNDFINQAYTQVRLTLSTGEVISRRREKQISTTRGSNPISVSFSTEDPQGALEKLIGLSTEEFFASVYLHQETIRDFLTTSPEKRSTTIDRMIGTYMLRALIKAVDPKVPNKAIKEAEADITAIEARLASATVISREIIDRKKADYGDPSTLPEKLKEIQRDLLPFLEKLGLPVPGSSLSELSTSLNNARNKQIELVAFYTTKAGNSSTLKQSYEQALYTNWEAVNRQRNLHGDPADLPTLLQNIRNRLTPIQQQLDLPECHENLNEIIRDLEDARRAQNSMVWRYTEEVGDLRKLKDRYNQAAILDWQGLNDLKVKWGDAQALPVMLQEIQASLSPIMSCLGIPIPKSSLPALEEGLAGARRLQPGEISRLERFASDCLNLRTRYIQAKQNIVELPVVPEELLTRQEDLENQVNNLNSLILDLNKQIGEREALYKEINNLQEEIIDLQDLNNRISQDQAELERLERESRQGKLYNQLLDIGHRYLEQFHPEHCPLCKKSIDELENVLSVISSEIPAEVETLQKEIQQYKNQLHLQKDHAARLEGKQTQLNEKEAYFASLETDLDQQIAQARKDRSQAAELLVNVNTNIDQVRARIEIAEESRKTIGVVLSEIEQLLSHTSIQDPLGALEMAAQTARNQANEIKIIDFQTIADKLAHAKQLDAIAQQEQRLLGRLQVVLAEVSKALNSFEESAYPELLENAIRAQHQQLVDIQAIDFQPIVADLDRASQLQYILEEEARLQKELNRVQIEIRQKLNLTNNQDELLNLLDKAIQEANDQAQKINKIDLQPIEAKLQIIRQIVEIASDEEKLRDLEQSYHTAKREKNRLNYRIGRLIELRNALHDISETTKRHQETIVSDVLNNLDIGRYYQQLDPHPAYTELQIEPESTSSGTYKYWIRARTADFDHSAYVQARFSTAQANCAAIAIFLAVNQHLSKNLDAVLLDDPSQSMDPDHKQRLAKTLASFPRQVVVATEDPQMFSLLRETFETPLVYELEPWSIKGTTIV